MLTVLNDKKYTIEDYMKLDDGNRYELIEGELIVVPRPRTKHQEIADELVTSFKIFLRENPVGKVYSDVDVFLGNKVVAPDVLFITKERLNIVEELNIQGAPDLVVEVLSPSTVKYDKKKKSQLYFTNGVKEYWLVDPDHQFVEVFIAGEKQWQWFGIFDREDVLTTKLLPGLEVNLAEVFRDNFK